MPVTPTLLFLLVFPTSARAAEPALFLRAVAPPVQETPPADDGPCCRPQRRSTDPASLPSDRKSVLLRAAAQALFDSNAPFVGMAPLRENEAKFAQIGERTPLETVYAICFQLGEARLQEGEIDGAIAAYERCLAIAKTLDDRDAQLGVMRRLALSESAPTASPTTTPTAASSRCAAAPSTSNPPAARRRSRSSRRSSRRWRRAT